MSKWMNRKRLLAVILALILALGSTLALADEEEEIHFSARIEAKANTNEALTGETVSLHLAWVESANMGYSIRWQWTDARGSAADSDRAWAYMEETGESFQFTFTEENSYRGYRAELTGENGEQVYSAMVSIALKTPEPAVEAVKGTAESAGEPAAENADPEEDDPEGTDPDSEDEEQLEEEGNPEGTDPDSEDEGQQEEEGNPERTDTDSGDEGQQEEEGNPEGTGTDPDAEGQQEEEGNPEGTDPDSGDEGQQEEEGNPEGTDTDSGDEGQQEEEGNPEGTGTDPDAEGQQEEKGNPEGTDTDSGDEGQQEEIENPEDPKELEDTDAELEIEEAADAEDVEAESEVEAQPEEIEAPEAAETEPETEAQTAEVEAQTAEEVKEETVEGTETATETEETGTAAEEPEEVELPAILTEEELSELGFLQVTVIREGGATLYAAMDETADTIATVESSRLFWVKVMDETWGQAQVSVDEETTLTGYILLKDVAAYLSEAPEEEQPIRSILVTSTLAGRTFVAVGEEITLNAELFGFLETDRYTVQWQYTPDGGETVMNAEDATELTYVYAITEENYLYSWRVEMTLLPAEVEAGTVTE